MYSQTSKEKLIPFRLGNKWGYASINNKKLIIDCIYDAAFPFSEGRAKVGKREEFFFNSTVIDFLNITGELKKYRSIKFGYIDEKGKEIIPIKYDDASEFKYGLAKVKIEHKIGIIDLNGNEIIPPSEEIEDIEILSEKFIKVKKQNMWGIINRSGNEILPFNFSSIYKIYNGKFYKCKDENEKKGLYNLNFKEVIPVEYDEIDLEGNLIVLKKHQTINSEYNERQENEYNDETESENNVIQDNYGFADSLGKEILPIIYERYYVKNEYLFLKLKNKWCMYNVKGNKLLSFEFDDFNIIDKKWIILKKGNKVGLYDFINGKKLVDFIYDELKIYEEKNIIYVKKNNLWGIISIKGNTIIPTLFNDIFVFDEKVIAVKKNNKWGIAINGKIMNNFIYDEILDYKNGYLIVLKDNKSGIIDVKGKEIVPIKYENIFFVKNRDIFLIKSDEKWGIMDANKNIISKFNKYKIVWSSYYFSIINFSGYFFLLRGEFFLRHEDNNLIYLPNFDTIKFLKTHYTLTKINTDKCNKKSLINFLNHLDGYYLFNDSLKEIKFLDTSSFFEHTKILTEYEEIIPLDDEKFLALCKNKVKVLNSMGKLVHEFNHEFDEIKHIHGHILLVEKNNQQGILNIFGNIIVPPLFKIEINKINNSVEIKLYTVYNIQDDSQNIHWKKLLLDYYGNKIIDVSDFQIYEYKYEKDFAEIIFYLSDDKSIIFNEPESTQSVIMSSFFSYTLGYLNTNNGECFWKD